MLAVGEHCEACKVGTMAILDAELCWLDLTTEEEVEFGSHVVAKLRRPKNGIKALASLNFVKYRDLSGCWLTDDRVIWLEMILSEQAGEGARLLKQICRLARHKGLAICGCPSPVKPTAWPEGRPWLCNSNDLAAWYLRHGFRIVQNKSETRVWFVPPGLELSVQVHLVE
jgi:SAM-dependent methyltransferase